MPRSGEIEAVKIHYLIPSCYKILNELLLGIITCIYLCYSPKLRIRTENQVNSCTGPLEFACFIISSLEDVSVFRGRFPLWCPYRADLQKSHWSELSGFLVNTPCWDLLELVFNTRIPPTRTVISGAVSPSSCARSTNISSAETAYLALMIIAETICFRFKDRK